GDLRGQGGGRRPGGANGPGGAGAMFGRRMLAEIMVTQADKNNDRKLSKVEFTTLADTWFDKMDSAKAGKLNQTQFAEKLGEVLNLPPAQTGSRASEQQAGGRPAPSSTGIIGTGLFTAADSDKD